MAIEWPLVLFSLLAGGGGGAMAFLALSEILGVGQKARKPIAIAALVLIIVGGCCSVLHLQQPSNIMAAATNLFSFSAISLELIFVGLNVLVLAIYIFLLYRESAGGAKVMAIIGLITGLALAFVTGHGYLMQAQPTWNSETLSIAYLGTALGIGGGLYASGMTLTKASEDEHTKMRIWVLIAQAIALIGVIAYGAFTGFSGDALVYWGGAVVVGTVCALICSWFVPKMPSMAYVVLILALIGGACIRAYMWLVGTGYLSLFDDAAAHTVLGF